MLNSPMSHTHLNEPIYGSQHLNKSNNMQNNKFKSNWEPSNPNQPKSPYGQDMQHQDLQHLLSFSSDLYQSNRDNIIRAPHRFEDYSRKHFNEQNDVDAYGMQPLLNNQQKYEQQMEINNSERRTPDTYGRSRIDQINRNLMDYEDIYNLNSQPDMNVYRRPTSPPSQKNLQTLQHLRSSSQRAIPSKLEVSQNYFFSSSFRSTSTAVQCHSGKTKRSHASTRTVNSTATFSRFSGIRNKNGNCK